VAKGGWLFGLLFASLVALAACGDTPRAERTGGAAKVTEPTVPAGNAARVDGTLISRESLSHWTRAAQLQSHCKTITRCRKQAMKFLISAQWVLHEAEAREVRVTDAEVTQDLEKQKRQAFRTENEFRAFVGRSGRTESDFRYQVKLHLLTQRLQQRLRAKGQALSAYAERFQRRYKARTACLRPYRITECGRVIDP
jgi:hypothetical protein